MPIGWLDLGRRDYTPVWRLQKELVARRLADDAAPDLLLFVEHEPVFAFGRGFFGRVPEALDGVPCYAVERGGGATYHGPGQLVGYPILKLKPGERDLHRYLRSLEEVLIRALADFGLAAERRVGFTGVWVRGQKVASIGVAVRRWVTYHGFALNVDPDLRYFQMIAPCGLPGSVVTSVAQLLGRPVVLREVRDRVLAHWEDVFAVRLRPAEKLPAGSYATR